MTTRMTQERTTKIDRRIENARLIEEMLKTEGWQLIQGTLNALRNEAMFHVLSIDTESIKWRQRLQTIDEIIGIPEQYILKGKVAKAEDL